MILVTQLVIQCDASDFSGLASLEPLTSLTSMKSMNPLTNQHMHCVNIRSMLLYTHEEDPESDIRLEPAMGLYGMKEFELLWERSTDTKALLAWSQGTVVLAFRGTASMANVLADVQVIPSPEFLRRYAFVCNCMIVSRK